MSAQGEKVLNYMKSYMGEALSTAQIAAATGISKGYISQVLKKLEGQVEELTRVNRTTWRLDFGVSERPPVVDGMDQPEVVMHLIGITRNGRLLLEAEDGIVYVASQVVV